MISSYDMKGHGYGVFLELKVPLEFPIVLLPIIHVMKIFDLAQACKKEKGRLRSENKIK